MKKILSGLLVVAMLATTNISSFAEWSADITGSCGENAVWSFDESTGVLTISGTGDMYTSYTPVDQWGYYPYRNEITEVVIEEGITSIAICAFGLFDPSQREPSKYPNLSKLSLSSSVKSIGDYAFFKSGLTSIEFSEKLETIGECAFMFSPLSGELKLPLSLNDIGQSAFSNTDITSVNLHEEMTIGGQAFSSCNSLNEVTIPRNLLYKTTSTGNASRDNGAFIGCTRLEKVVVFGGGLVRINLSSDKENGLSGNMFNGCISLKQVEIYDADISYVVAVGTDGQTFDMTNNPTFYIYKGSTTEKTLDNAGYLTGTNVVYIANTTALEKAIKFAEEMDTSLYTDESVNALDKIIDEGKSVLEDPDATQNSVDNAVKAIEDVIEALKYKAADYTAVDEVIAKVPADLSVYTEESVAVLNAAINAIIKDKDITEQDIVDGYAKAIEEAIEALELKFLGAITGTVFAPGVDTTITVEISANGEVIYTIEVANGEYTVSNLEDVDYVVTFSAENCAPRNYQVTVANGDVALDVEIHLYGDINGDGKISTADVGIANAHAKAVVILHGYDFAVADVTGDGKITTVDVGVINMQIQN